MTPAMTLTERYLRAVAAQLPKTTRDDIVAELKDAIQTRIEDREEALGRPLDEADEEVVLREFGHPLSVAGRYGSGPHHVVGPELYPWWIFGVKAGLFALLALSLLSLVVRTLIGDLSVGQGIGQAFAGFFSGAVALIGYATLGAFIIERQPVKPAFMREWRVRDLGLFELGGLDADTVSRHLAGAAEERRERRAAKSPYALSPTARALASAACWVVVLLWWAGLMPIAHFDPSDFGGLVDGVDYGALLQQILAALYWPGVIYAACRVAFDLMRAARPEAVRLTALGDLGFALAQAALFVWIWTVSELSPLIRVDTLGEFISRARDGLHAGQHAHDWLLATVLMVCVAIGFIQAAYKGLAAAWRLITGQVGPCTGGHVSADQAPA